jgi:hypothetical protein
LALERASVVYDARYWREQAVLCMEIARQISDIHAAARMRATATEYFARATELEGRTEARVAPDGSPDT